MAQIPNDPDFLDFIRDMRRLGASSQSIAAALNISPWADRNGARWHPRQVEQICSAGSAPVASTAPDGGQVAGGCDCPFHRRLQLLQAIGGWQPFDLDTAGRIASYLAAGESDQTVAARLNRDGIVAPSGRSWSPRVVAAMAYLGLPGRAAAVTSSKVEVAA